MKGLGLTSLNLKLAHAQVSPKYFRPTEVETLLGDPKKASEKLGWPPDGTSQFRGFVFGVRSGFGVRGLGGLGFRLGFPV